MLLSLHTLHTYLGYMYDHYTAQVASTHLFEIIMKILQPLMLITREEHYDNKTSLQECIRYLITKTVIHTKHSLASIFL